MRLADDTPAGTSAAWAVWSAWRGDRVLFARVVRAAVYEIEHAFGEQPTCLIEVAVKGDIERFASADDMLEHATAQALRSFDSIKVTVEVGPSSAALVVARKPTPPLSEHEVPGAVLLVRAAGPARNSVGSVRDGIAAAFDRGGFAWVKPHRDVGGLGRARPVLMGRVRARRRYLAAAYGIGVGAASVIVIGALAVAGVDVSESLAVAVGSAPAIIGGLAGLFESLWPRLRDAVFPAIEIAERTPGRRLAHLTLRGASLAAAPLLGALVKSLIDAA
ncbi:MAG: hypothetical protein M3401_10900 [Actinomycetota bacterium]|nr:hypothetical protein [Actinomycetota bacterium]